MNEAEKLPIIYSAHHAESKFPSIFNFNLRTALTGEQQIRFSDYGTRQTVPENGILTLRPKVSRGIVDLNRSPNNATLHPDYDFSLPKNKIWKEGMEPTDLEKQQIKKKFYDTYHDQILRGVDTFSKPGLVVAWDNTAHKVIGKNEAGNPEMMKAIILSNRGMENSADNPNEITSCDPNFLLEMAYQLGRALREYNLPDEIRLNLVYKGGYISEHYNDRRHPNEIKNSHGVQSFQVEYDTTLTHNQETLESYPEKMKNLKKAFELAMYKTYANFLPQS